MPREYYLDWMRVAAEEAYHFSLLRDHLQSLGMEYGELPAHDNLWSMCEKTRDDDRPAPSRAEALPAVQ